MAPGQFIDLNEQDMRRLFATVGPEYCRIAEAESAFVAGAAAMG